MSQPMAHIVVRFNDPDTPDFSVRDAAMSGFVHQVPTSFELGIEIRSITGGEEKYEKMCASLRELVSKMTTEWPDYDYIYDTLKEILDAADSE